MLANRWRDSNSKLLELAVGATTLGVVLEAALDPLEPVALAWPGLAVGTTVVGLVAGWYLSRESAPLLMSRYSTEQVTDGWRSGFFATTLVVSLLLFAAVLTTTDPPLYQTVLCPAVALLGLEGLSATTESSGSASRD